MFNKLLGTVLFSGIALGLTGGARADIASKGYVDTRPDGTTIEQIATPGDNQGKFQVKDGAISAAKLSAGVGTGGKVLKMNAGGTALEWGDDADTPYTLPAATADVLGGVKVGVVTAATDSNAPSNNNTAGVAVNMNTANRAYVPASNGTNLGVVRGQALATATANLYQSAGITSDGALYYNPSQVAVGSATAPTGIAAMWVE